ncbi:MAG: twin-arginine translocase TatA/TatE family subunit [Aquificae bacterium]|nr:twin-arginine translocase TatA/TatE family subunit [Aquificota bacterium]
MFGPFHGWEILIILFIVLLIFGPGRLGELGKSLGEGIRNFKKAVSGEDNTSNQNTTQPAQQSQQTTQQNDQQQTAHRQTQQESQSNPSQENKQT